MCYEYRSHNIKTSFIAISNHREKGVLNLSESFRTFRPDYRPPRNLFFPANVQHSVPGPDYWKNPGRIIRSPRKIVLPYRCNNQMSGRIFGKIRAGLSGPADLEDGQSMQSIRCLAGFLEKSGPDYPARQISKLVNPCIQSDVRPDYYKNPGRIIRPS